MTRLLLIRHGETDWNAQSRMQGQSDEPLNAQGRAQAAAVKVRLAGETIHAIYASDLARAWETAQALGITPIKAAPRLREMNFGTWEGLTYEEIQAYDPDVLARWGADVMDFTPPGGENLRQFAQRVAPVLEEMRNDHPEETVLLVAHGGSLQILLALALGLSPEKYWQFYMKPGFVSEVSLYPEGAIVNLLNDVCHLGKNWRNEWDSSP